MDSVRIPVTQDMALFGRIVQCTTSYRNLVVGDKYVVVGWFRPTIDFAETPFSLAVSKYELNFHDYSSNACIFGRVTCAPASHFMATGEVLP
jgi:hypothetical protein